MNQVKLLSLTDDTARVGGYGVVFGGKDLEGETFSAETDFALGYVPQPRVYYDHAMRDVKHHLGAVVDIKADETGLWIEAELDRSRAYADLVLDLVQKGIIGWSSGSIGHLVQRDGGLIKAWPIAEFSLTPTPAEPRTLGVELLKHMEIGTAEPEGAGNAPAEAVQEPQPITHIIEVTTMTEDIKAVGREEFDELSGKLDSILKALENSPAAKNAGYIAPDSTNDHAGVKSFGDWLIAVRRGNTKRLHDVYGSVKDLQEVAGQQGGYLVPEDYSNMLLQVTPLENPVLSRVTRVPVNVDSGKYPALDMFAAPTAGSGNTAWAAGLTAATTAEGGTLTETQPTFEELSWQVHKIGGYVEVTNELIADSPTSIEALLTRLFRLAINNKMERHILRGSGAGEPLGIFNASCAVGVTTAGDNVFAEADAMGILARFLPMGGAPVWIMHRSIIPDLAAFSDTTSALIDWRAGVSGTLLGYPIVFSEHMPQANADAVLLADLSAYAVFERQGLQIGYSEHAAFTADKGTWRFTYRADGKPWLRSAITLADPTGSYTVSPFVYHND